MLSTREILLEYVSPLFGAIFANMMFAAPLKDVRRAVQKGSLGHLNPTPWAVMTGNTLGWITYSYLLNNYFIFWANAPGFIFSIWLNMAAAKLQYCDRLADNMRSSFVELVETSQNTVEESLRQRNRHNANFNFHRTGCRENSNAIGDHTDELWWESQDIEATWKRTNGHGVDPDDGSRDHELEHAAMDEISNTHHVLNNFGELRAMAMEIATERMEAPAPHEKVVVGVIIAWFAFISCIVFIPLDSKQREFVIGIAVNINMSFFYGAPLSIIFKVIKTKDSSWVHRKTMIMNTLCALFFLAFGIGRMDYFLIVPNGIGVLLGAVQLFLRLLIPCSEEVTRIEKSSNQSQKVVCKNDTNDTTINRPKSEISTEDDRRSVCSA